MNIKEEGKPTVAVGYTKEEVSQIQRKLDMQLGPEFISTRSGPGNSKLTYIEGWKVINLANEVFGFNGWSSTLLDTTVDYVDVDAQGKVSLGLACNVRVTLKDGTFHDDVGYGIATNQPRKGEAFEKARKEAVTDALKRALKNFGPLLGNCLYDKNFCVRVGKIPSEVPGPLDPNYLFRKSDFRQANPDDNTPAYKKVQGIEPLKNVQADVGLEFDDLDPIYLIAGDIENMDPALMMKTSPDKEAKMSTAPSVQPAKPIPPMGMTPSMVQPQPMVPSMPQNMPQPNIQSNMQPIVPQQPIRTSAGISVPPPQSSTPFQNNLSLSNQSNQKPKNDFKPVTKNSREESTFTPFGAPPEKRMK